MDANESIRVGIEVSVSKDVQKEVENAPTLHQSEES
jgi:hypothetical protein